MENKKTYETRMESLSPLISEIVSAGGTVEITVTGNSMWPMLLHRKSKVRVARAENIKIGDIPLYKRENGDYILHRIVDRDESGYVCSGDHQWQLERGITDEMIICVVTDFKRRNKWTSCENKAYKLYRSVWSALRPTRHIIDALKKRIKRVLCRNQ